MSNMLEQAIVDAKTLREAAVKNAIKVVATALERINQP